MCLDWVTGGQRIRLRRARENPLNPVDLPNGGLFGMDIIFVWTVLGFCHLLCFVLGGLSGFTTGSFKGCLRVTSVVENLSSGLKTGFEDHFRDGLYIPLSELVIKRRIIHIGVRL